MNIKEYMELRKVASENIRKNIGGYLGSNVPNFEYVSKLGRLGFVTEEDRDNGLISMATVHKFEKAGYYPYFSKNAMPYEDGDSKTNKLVKYPRTVADNLFFIASPDSFIASTISHWTKRVEGNATGDIIADRKDIKIQLMPAQTVNDALLVVRTLRPNKRDGSDFKVSLDDSMLNLIKCGYVTAYKVSADFNVTAPFLGYILVYMDKKNDFVIEFKINEVNIKKNFIVWKEFKNEVINCIKNQINSGLYKHEYLDLLDMTEDDYSKMFETTTVNVVDKTVINYVMPEPESKDVPEAPAEEPKVKEKKESKRKKKEKGVDNYDGEYVEQLINKVQNGTATKEEEDTLNAIIFKETGVVMGSDNSEEDDGYMDVSDYEGDFGNDPEEVYEEDDELGEESEA